MTAQEIVDKFLKNEIAANHARDYASCEGISEIEIYHLLHAEVKKAEEIQAQYHAVLERVMQYIASRAFYMPVELWRDVETLLNNGAL